MSKKIEQDAEAKAKADAEAKAKAEEEAAKADQENLDSESSSKKEDIDYKKIAEEERARRDALEQVIIKNKINDKKGKKKNQDEDEEVEDEDEEKPLTRKEASELLQKERQKILVEANEDRIIEIADDIAENDGEAEAIIETFKNRIFPESLSLREKMLEAQAIVNRTKLISKNNELSRALKNRGSVSNDAADTHRDPQEGSAPKLSDSDARAYQRAGFVYDPKDRLYKKKLTNGKTLVKDPKTKATWLR